MQWYILVLTPPVFLAWGLTPSGVVLCRTFSTVVVEHFFFNLAIFIKNISANIVFSFMFKIYCTLKGRGVHC